MNWQDHCLLNCTRRHFFRECGVGVGRVGLASLLSEAVWSAPNQAMAPRRPHHQPRARSIIYLFMAGAPSQIDLLDDKPTLRELDGQACPESVVKGKRFAFMERMANPKLFGSPRRFRRNGSSGNAVSDLLPHIAAMADDIAIIRSMQTENFNHAPAKIFAHTGSVIAGRPSMGAWITYGLGSESKDLPGFVVMQSGPRGPRNGPIIWGSGFLPSSYQATPFLPGPEPVFNLSSQPGVTLERQRRALDALRDLNTLRHQETGDDEITTRIASYETAYRMQMSGPDLVDISREPAETLTLYGAEPGKATFANNCLLARRLVERGVRCIQLYHTDWDHHTGIEKGLEARCKEVDQASAALVQDLKRRGLLDSTLVVWGGEFGRTPLAEGAGASIGRNHHIDAYSIWMAGGGVRPGITVGTTDDFGFHVVEDKVSVHDLHATILHLMGLDHTRLTFKFQGRDFRLTDVAGNVAPKLLG